MKLKELESYLSQCEPFSQPKIKLEQYPTSSHVASRMLYAAQDNIRGGLVCDLGSGWGILSIGCVLVGAAFVCGFEIDSGAIQTAKENVQEVLDEDSASAIDFLHVDISPAVAKNGLEKFSECFDTVIMNPPFGTKNNEGIDWNFMQVALQLVKPGGHIYSLHKTSTRQFFTKKFKSPFLMSLNGCPMTMRDVEQTETEVEVGEDKIINVNARVLAEVQFNLPKVYKFHKEKSVDIAVDFWCFEKMTA